MNNELMSVGNLAKKLNVSVRTLQYYDKIDLLKPSIISEGGRRLYNNKDMAILHQIITLKFLGFSLEDIKKKIIPVKSHDDVAKVLEQQEEILVQQILNMQKSLDAIKMFRSDIVSCNAIDWSMYADILSIIRENNENCWVVKHFDIGMMKNVKEKFTDKTAQIGLDSWKDLCRQAAELNDKGIDPKGKEGLELAKEWWSMVMEFTAGDIELLQKLFVFHESRNQWPKEFRIMQEKADPFIESAIEAYFEKEGITIG